MSRIGSTSNTAANQQQNNGQNQSNQSNSQSSSSSSPNTTSTSSSNSNSAIVPVDPHMPQVLGLACHTATGGGTTTTSTGANVTMTPELLARIQLAALLPILGPATPGLLGTLMNLYTAVRGVPNPLANLNNQLPNDNNLIEAPPDSNNNPQGPPLLEAPPQNVDPQPDPNPPAIVAPIPVVPNPPNNGPSPPIPPPNDADPSNPNSRFPPFVNNWIQYTTKHRGPYTYGRSPELKAVDAALAAYKANPTVDNLRALAKAISAWRASKPKPTTGFGVLSMRAKEMNDLSKFVEGEYARYLRGQLVNDPAQFLLNNPLRVFGKGHGVHDFYVGFADGSVDGFTRDQTENLSLMGAGDGDPIRMASVGMYTTVTDTSTRADVDAMFYPIPNDADMLTTGQITGCCFMMRTNPDTGQLECAHIQPKAPWRDGYELEAYLKTLYAGDPNVKFYGRQEFLGQQSDGGSRTIVGERQDDGTWNIYAQTNQRDANPVVQSVMQIYP